MSETVWKFQLPLEARFSLEIPDLIEPLCVALQGEHACLWVRVQPEQPKKIFKFRWVATGEIEESEEGLGAYLGTIQFEEETEPSFTSIIDAMFEGTPIEPPSTRVFHLFLLC